MEAKEYVPIITALIAILPSILDRYSKQKSKDNKSIWGSYSNYITRIGLSVFLLSIGFILAYYFMKSDLEFKQKYYAISKKLTNEIVRNDSLNRISLYGLQLQNQLLSEEIDRLKNLNHTPPTNRVELYEHENFLGNRIFLYPAEYRDLQIYWMNDKISSIKIVGDVDVIAFEHINLSGATLPLNSSINSLLNAGFNDRISSVIVRDR